MIDQKQTQSEQQPGQQPAQQPAAAPQQQPTVREKLRSAWARLQCTRVLRRHRVQNHRRRRMAHAVAWMGANPITGSVGDGLYSIGFTAEYMAICASRGLGSAAGRFWQGLQALARGVMASAFPEAARVLGDVFGPFYVFLRGIRNLLAYGRRVRRERGLAPAVWECLCYLGRGIRLYARLLPRMAAYFVPVALGAAFVVLVSSTLAAPYVLEVQLEGHTVGYVATQNVFDKARESVLERINFAGTSETSWDLEPTYRLAVAGEVMDEYQMTDTILQAASDQINTGTALYLDGELVAVCADGQALRSYLAGLLAPYEDNADPNTRVRFSREVELVDGIFFVDSFRDYNAVVQQLEGVRVAQKDYTVIAGDSISLIASKNGLTVSELCELNSGIGLAIDSAIFPGDSLIVTREEAMLEVLITRTETRDEEIPYTTERTSSSQYSFGTTRTIQAGQNGLRRYTLENTYDTAGNLLQQEVVAIEVVKEPVTEQIVTGTRLPSGSVAQVGNGTFIWPVPGYRYCSRWYGNGHKGVDICGPAGLPIYASASGVVTKAGYNRAGAGSGYGYSVIINHGNGYSTVYAHCLSLTVSAGQAVSQGQLIGYLGSTGRSTGNHCHFEIRYNGSYIPPQNYFNR